MTLLRAGLERSDQLSDDGRTGDMVRIPGGTFRMGSDRHYPEEAPVHRVTVDDFLIDRTPVTNRQFKVFVKATGHKTFAEIPPDPKDYPDALPHMLYAGSLVFTPPPAVTNLRDWSQWWQFMKGADWRHPYGPKSNINVQDHHPVVHVCFSNRPFGVKRFQTIHHCNVDVARGLALLFGIGTRALPSWDSRTRRNNLLVGLA